MTSEIRYPLGYFGRGIDLHGYDPEGSQKRLDGEFEQFLIWARENLPEAKTLSPETLSLMFYAFQVGEDAGAQNGYC